MKRAFEVDIGIRLRYAGQDWTVASEPGLDIVLRNEEGLEITASWASILQAPDYALLGHEEAPLHPYQTRFDQLPEHVRRKALALERHVLEILTGSPTKGGPLNPDYDSSLSLNKRIRRKVAELRGEDPKTKVGERQVKRWLAAYQQDNKGVFGLVDGRHLRLAQSHSSTDRVVMRAIDRVASRLEGLSDVSLEEIFRLVRNELGAQGELAEGPEEPGKVRLPGRTKLAQLVHVTAPFLFKTARQRDSFLANLRQRPFGRAHAERPGQTVILDYTSWDILAISEIDGSELRLRLLIALDLWSRAIVAWDLIEVEPRGIDATRLVVGVLFPKLWHPSWPEESKWRYTGVPRHVVIEVFGLDADAELANAPPLLPEMLVVDGGRIFISAHLEGLADEFGFDFMFARPYKGSDKAPIEVLFRTLRLRFAEGTRGYTGPNTQHRGKQVRAYHTRTELMLLIGEVITSEYNERRHDSCYDPKNPKVKLSPNQMLDLGLAMQSFLSVPVSRNAYYQALRPVTVARIKDNGVHIQGRRYDGPELNPYRGAKSPYTHLGGKWPFLVDDREPTYIFFQDPYPAKGEEGRYFPIAWVDADHISRPFMDILGEHAKAAQEADGFDNHAEIDARRDARRNRYDAWVTGQNRLGRAKVLSELYRLNSRTNGGKLDRPTRNTLSRQQAALDEQNRLLGPAAPPPLAPFPVVPPSPPDFAEVEYEGHRIKTLDLDLDFKLSDDLYEPEEEDDE